MNSVNLISVPISITSKDQALATIAQWVIEGQGTRDKGQGKKEESRASGRTNLISLSPQPLSLIPRIITTPNPEIIVSAQKDLEFLKALQSADLAIPDGIGIVWALRILNTEYRILNGNTECRIPNTEWKSKLVRLARNIHSKFSIQNSVFSLSRLSGLDFMESLITLAARRGWRVMLVGGKPGIAEKAAEILQEKVQWREGQTVKRSNQIVALSGPQHIDKASPHERNELLNSINSFSPDLLFVAFGHGKQEKWLRANRHRLHAGVAMGVGGALDQIVDPSLRPPAYINSIGLGWLYRLVRQPWRWRRQMNLFRFIKMVIKQREFVFRHKFPLDKGY